MGRQGKRGDRGRRGDSRTTAGAATGTAGPCPCGRLGSYADCCGRLHHGLAGAATAEELMRSRFSAFAVGDVDYLRRTWHPDTRPPRLTLDPQRQWTLLEIIASERGGLFDATGGVEFRAHYRDRGRVGAQHERSRFTRVDGAWVYLDGS